MSCRSCSGVVQPCLPDNKMPGNAVILEGDGKETLPAFSVFFPSGNFFRKQHPAPSLAAASRVL